MTRKLTTHHKLRPRATRRRNFKPGLLLILLPLLLGLLSVLFVVSGGYSYTLGLLGNDRLITDNWQAADDAFTSRIPIYERKFAYYRLKEGQTLDTVASYFSVDRQKLAQLNPGDMVAGTTVKVTPVEHPLEPTGGPNGNLRTALIENDRGFLRVRQPFRFPLATTTIPDLMNFLRRYNAIEQIGPKTYRLNRGISLEGNIRLDVTSDTVEKLELRSAPNDVVCLCLDQASALLKDVTVVSHDPSTGKPDKTYADERAFVRAKNGRMDAVNVVFSYLGNDLPDEQKKLARTNEAQKEGGTYGVSWRISDDMLGVEIATGWVEGSSFVNNHFGAYSYGASGIMWRNNLFAHNDVYGLDPHDDSNNALVENNLFAYNGKHGFIVSKRCNYNIIRNNTSVGNKLHGYMLHQDSVYNLMEDNVAYDNTDNYVIYDSDYNMVRNNTGYNARSTHVRINEGARNNYVMNNQFVGGRRGVFVYGGAANVYVSSNTFKVGKEILTTDSAQNVFFGQNVIDRLAYKVQPLDRLIFGPNEIQELEEFVAPDAVPYPADYTLGIVEPIH